MATFTKYKQLDTMEVQLTPKEWAIRLAQEMRSQSSEAEFITVAAEKPYREWPWVKPFFKLGEQAEARYPGNSPEDIRARNQLDRKLRTEFHALKKLICQANEIITGKAETIGLKTALKLSTLHSLVLQDAFGRTVRKAIPLIQTSKAADPDESEERQAFLKELANYTNASSGIDAGSRLHFRSLIEDWADKSTMFIMDLFAHKNAVHAVQETYFDGHPILIP